MRVEHMENRQSAVNNGYAQNRLENGAKEQDGKVKNGSINAVNLNLFDDEIANRKHKAIQDAFKFVKDQFEADGTIDDALDKMHQHTEQSREVLKEAQKAIKVLNEEKEQMKETCGGENSEEYKVYLETNYNVQRQDWAERKDMAQRDISIQAATIRGVKGEMVKNQGMLDAGKAKETMMEASEKEIAGMLLEEAKEKIEETLEDAVEKGEEKKEETEEMKEKLEKIQLEQEKKAKEAEELSDKAHDDSTKTRGDSSINMDYVYEAMKQNNSQILEAQKLLPEDLKGAIVDDIL